MRTSDFTEGSVWKGLCVFALPLLLTSMIQQLYNTVDLIFVGNIVGKEASAAVGSTSLLINCVIGFFNGMGAGVGVITAQYFGAKEEKRVKETIHTAAGLSIVLSLAVMVLGLLLSPLFLKWMNVPENIMDLALTYIRIYFLSILSIVSYNISAGILRALGNSRSPMIYQLLGGMVNIIGNAIFMCLLDLGIAGAALSTLLSQSFAAILTMRTLYKMPMEYRLELRQIKILPSYTKKIFCIGIPAALQSMVITFANIILQSQINVFGVESMAAYAAYCKMEGFLFLPQWAIGQANMNIVGQNIGAKKMDRVEKSTKIALILAMGITVAISFIILLYPEEIFRLFSEEREVITLSVKIAKTTFRFYFLYAIVEVLSGVIRGAGKAMPPMMITIFNMCFVRLLVLRILLHFTNTVDGVAVLFPITWATTSASMLCYYFSGKWKVFLPN